ncbi:MAG: hypothetical protein NDI69_09135 [Bacteriovoracaceae bacterium]|nr:hypothetical protein [Bacteriovoracaceae bacterium]
MSLIYELKLTEFKRICYGALAQALTLTKNQLFVITNKVHAFVRLYEYNGFDSRKSR